MKKNILLIVNKLDIGGAEIYVLTFANRLNQMGYKVFVASSGGKLVSKLDNGIEHITVRSNAKEINGILNTANNINKLVSKYNIDLIHSNSVFTCLMAKLGTLFKGTSIINTAHSWGTNKNFISAQIINFCATKVIAVSRSTANNYVKNGLNKKKIFVIHNGIDTNKFSKLPEGTVQILRNELNLSTDDFVITNIARMEETRKGHNTLIDAAKQVTLKHPKTKFLLVGDGNLKEGLIKKVKEYNLEKNILFLGDREDIPELLSLSKIFCLASDWEGLPLTIAEAMSCGIPVIASDISGIPEIVTEGETGYLIPPGNAPTLADKIIKLIENPDLLKSMQNKGTQICHDRFNIDKQILAIDKLYQSL